MTESLLCTFLSYVRLTAYEEQLAHYWAQTIGLEWEENQFYKKNFAEQFMVRLKSQHKHITDFDKFDFNPIKLDQERHKEEKKKIPAEVKKQAKLQKDLKDKFYAYAIVDDIMERVNGSLIEPPTLFKGRGKHPRAGMMKPRITP